ncbi:uracil-DNA glycosylase family protein [Jeotgalibaca dankookensis]|uniref:uracil-DNA glycosylase family protein n=1 Tax=Jeotgalibaca dankookensis TaxID=708126 RepID=UPI000785A008|nr:uracil-DNA glycosylase family protein [Jeotgalibaca dankookensis]
MDSFYEEIKEKIMRDPENAFYTEKGIEPLFSAPKEAKIAVVGQAPGIRAQTSMKYWNDPSGVRLRKWMGVTDQEFYETDYFTVLPMDFYYPGKAKTGDLPPRKDFAAKWHPLILAGLPNVELIILAGSYAQNYYLKGVKGRNLTETVENYQAFLPDYFPIVHPSPLNGRWLKVNPWFQEEVVPVLQNKVDTIIRSN